MMRVVLRAAVSGWLLASVAMAAPIARDLPVNWGKFADPQFSSDTNATPQETSALRVEEKKIFDILRRAPTWSHLHGFDITVFGSGAAQDLDGRDAFLGHSVLPLRLQGQLNLVIQEKNSDGSVFNDRPNGVSVSINSLECIQLENAALEDGPTGDGAGSFYYGLPRSLRNVGGFPVYGNCVVITHRSEAPFIPVTRERYLEAQISACRQDIVVNAEVKKTVGWSPFRTAWALRSILNKRTSEDRKTINRDKLQLASLSTKQRQSPAIVSGREVLEGGIEYYPLVDRSELGTVVSARNPNFYDAAKPRMNVQSITVNFDITKPGLQTELESGIDWKALEKLLETAP